MYGLSEAKFSVVVKSVSTNAKTTSKTISGVNFTLDMGDTYDTSTADYPAPATIREFGQKLIALTLNTYSTTTLNASFDITI